MAMMGVSNLRVHLAPPHQHHLTTGLVRMLAEPCLLYAALMGGVRGGEFSTLFSTLVRHDTTKPRWNDLQKASHTQGLGGFKISGCAGTTIAKDATI